MNQKPDLAYQRKRQRYHKKGPSGVPKPPHGERGPQSNADTATDHEDHPTNMESRSLEADAAYEFSGETPESSAPPASKPEAADVPGAPPTESAQESGGPPADPQSQRREQERMRREQEREKRDNERKERERRDQERRDQQRRDQDRKERDRLMELRNLDVESIVSKAWDIYGAEVKEEGVELFPDNDARELAKRSFRLAEIFLLEESRLRRLRADPLPGEGSPSGENGAAPSASDAPSTPGSEPTMGE